VLTAAHCLEGYNKGTYFVRAGDYNTDVSKCSYYRIKLSWNLQERLYFPNIWHFILYLTLSDKRGNGSRS